LSILAGLNVIEIYGPGAAALAAKWGARVTILEQPEGTPLREVPPYYEHSGDRRSAMWQWLSRGKMAVRLSPEAAGEACSGQT
jgi:crotonobetainyl-CoA:carnitine CoA-transferase CaiB-like acyl-CoA transferase